MKDDLETLSEGFPFYILSNKMDADGDRLAITADTGDLYAPRKTGVHNVHLAKFAGKEHPDPLQ